VPLDERAADNRENSGRRTNAAGERHGKAPARHHQGLKQKL
jgi:hypothetical protein